MALYAIAGSVGAGKSFCAVNSLMADVIRDTRRPVYTNLPCDGEELEWYLTWLAPKSAALREEYRKRLHFLREGEEEAFEEYWVEIRWVDHSRAGALITRDCWPRNTERALRRGWEKIEKEVPWPENPYQEQEYRRGSDQCVYELRRRSLGMHDRVREFWFFTEPNAAVFLDETADLFNALASKERPKTLQSYINHHRHYKDDLYFFFQAVDDLDVQIRRKILYLYHIENMKTQHMFNHWSMKGFKWPIQHFRVRQFLARKVLSKGLDYDRFEPLLCYKVWPTRRKYKNYRSFSAASTLKGKRLPPAGAASSDLDRPWDRIKDWVFNLGTPLSVLAMVATGAYMGYRLLWAMASVDSNDVAKHLGGPGKEASLSASAGKSENGKRNGDPGYGTNGVGTVVTTNGVTTNIPVERVCLVLRSSVKTNRAVYRVGEEFPGRGRIARVCDDGLVFEGGGSGSWAVLFPGGRGAGSGPGNRNL